MAMSEARKTGMIEGLTMRLGNNAERLATVTSKMYTIKERHLGCHPRPGVNVKEGKPTPVTDGSIRDLGNVIDAQAVILNELEDLVQHLSEM